MRASTSSGPSWRITATQGQRSRARLLAERHEIESDVWLVEPIATALPLTATTATATDARATPIPAGLTPRPATV